MELYHRHMGEGKPLVILHGLFGSGDNWQTLGRRYADHFSVYLVDQRNHGRSPHTESHSYQEMTDDLLAFLEAHKLDKVHLMGHSMGGKTAMLFASDHSAMVERLVVADMAPKPYKVHHRELVDQLLGADLSALTERSEVEAHLEKGIPDAATRQFFLKNLYWKSKGELAWRFNLKTLSDNLVEISAEAGQQICLNDTLFIRGGKSNYIQDSDVQWIDHYFPNHRLHTIANAGHWLHAEAPDEFYDVTLEFLTA